MDGEGGHVLERSESHASHTSVRSQRSQYAHFRLRKHASYTSSSASSIAPSDKSLTSFPSFSPESPKDDRTLTIPAVDETTYPTRKVSEVDQLVRPPRSPHERTALFDDTSFVSGNVPGALNQADDEHIERLLARKGALALVRQLADDLAQRDAQIAALRRKAEDRERALRKIIIECGLSNLDLETRLRTIEDSAKITHTLGQGETATLGIETLINDAISESFDLNTLEGEATIRASERAKRNEIGTDDKNVVKGWKSLIWGTTMNKKAHSTSGTNGEVKDHKTPNHITAGTRTTIISDDLFRPPEVRPLRNQSRSSSMQSLPLASERKSSATLATLALKLVAGNTNTIREDKALVGRGRAFSNSEGQSGRTASTVSARTSASTRSIQPKAAPKEIPSHRRQTVAVGGNRSAQDRWDTMISSPQSTVSIGTDNFGPVEMDSILDPRVQPPTLTHIYNNRYNAEFLTDRFGFIYDQRRKKRQKEAADLIQKSKHRSRVELLSSVRNGLGVDDTDSELERAHETERPDTPVSLEEDGNKSASRWHDYLKIATFHTELLSHTPSTNAPTFEVMEGHSEPTSPGITTEGRGFLPTASTTAPAISAAAEETSTTNSATISAADALRKDDVEPVKLLLEQLSDVHDSLQREKTVKWNDFLRKVRAERKREGEAAAETNPNRANNIMPEVLVSDGEMIGIAGVGVKGKVGRAKWNEFKTLLLGGIPVAYRAKIWAECSGATALRVPGYYDDLVARCSTDDDPAIAAQIQMDINRTLTDNIFFRRGPGVTKLNEVLLAYSRRNTEVGYCQGMNLITACLLLIMPTAEDAFWVLTSVIENILPRGYYDHSLLASRADQQVLRQYVSSILPRLSTHLDELGIELEALTFQWFLSVFTDCLSAEALFRVWDVVLCTNDGSTFLFQVALALLKLNEQQLLACDTPASIYTYINHQMTNHAISIDGLIHASEGLRKVVKREDVETRRHKAIEAEKALMRQREAKNNQRKAERAAKANGHGLVNASGKTTEVIDKQETVKKVPAMPVTPSRTPSIQLLLGEDEYGELTVRTPMPIDEEVNMGLG